MQGPRWHCHAPGHSHKGRIQELFPARPGAEWGGRGSSSTAAHPSAAAARLSPSLAAPSPWGRWHQQWDAATPHGSLVTRGCGRTPRLTCGRTTSTLGARLGVLSTLGAPSGSVGTRAALTLLVPVPCPSVLPMAFPMAAEGDAALEQLCAVGRSCPCWEGAAQHGQGAAAMEPCPSHSTFRVQTAPAAPQSPRSGGHGCRKDTDPSVLPKGQIH